MADALADPARLHRVGGTVAVVTVVHGRRAHLVAQHASLARQTRRPDRWVVVAMADPGLGDWRPTGAPRPDVLHLDADPAALPLAAARNLGAAAALDAGADVLVFLDVDCLAGPGLLAAYAADVDHDPATVWCGPVTYLPPAPSYDLDHLGELDHPHPARPAPEAGERRRDDRWELFWSLSFAVSARAWTEVGGFCEAYRGYGGEDTDFGQQAREAGLRLGWTGGPRAYHQHHAVQRPPVGHAADIVRNGRVFADRWGWWPMTGWLTELAEVGVVRRTRDGWVLA